MQLQLIRNTLRLQHIEKMDVELAVLKVYVRLAFDLQYFKGENHYMENV